MFFNGDHLLSWGLKYRYILAPHFPSVKEKSLLFLPISALTQHQMN